MPDLVINGERRVFPDSVADLAALMRAMDYADKRVAVELNGVIVPRGRHAATRLATGDVLEIVVAVGGG
jgi:sulfur carrier protein